MDSDIEKVVAKVVAEMAGNAEIKRRDTDQAHPRCWNFVEFHPYCRTAGIVSVVDIGDHPHIVCYGCGILRDIATVSYKLSAIESVGEDLAAAEAEEALEGVLDDAE